MNGHHDVVRVYNGDFVVFVFIGIYVATQGPNARHHAQRKHEAAYNAAAHDEYVDVDIFQSDLLEEATQHTVDRIV